MATQIRAKTTFRNSKELPDGIIRKGQTATVRNRYAEELTEQGLAEIADSEGDSDSDTSSSEGTPSDESGVDWSDPLPEDTPKRDLLTGADIRTLDDLRFAVENEEIGRIKGVGPAREEQIQEFLESLTE